MPTETVEYTIKKRFPHMGLNIRTPVNYDIVGLERYFIAMEFSNSAQRSASSVLQRLSSSAFLTYWCKDALEQKYLSFFALPVALAEEHTQIIDRLVEEGILSDYRAERLEWSRHPELKSSYYDFVKGSWSMASGMR